MKGLYQIFADRSKRKIVSLVNVTFDFLFGLKYFRWQFVTTVIAIYLECSTE